MKENLESTNKGAGESTKVEEGKKKEGKQQFMLSHTKLQEERGFKKNYRHFL